MKLGEITKTATENAPKAAGAYVQATTQGLPMLGLVSVSGQLGLTPDGEFAGSDAAAQVKQAMANVKAILEASGSDIDHVLKTTIYVNVTHMAETAAINDAYAAAFAADKLQARSMVTVAGLPKDAAVEIDAMAVKFK